MGAITENKFDTYLKTNLPQEEYIGGLKELFKSAHRRTKALNNPGSITHAELIELADLLNTSAWTLYNDYEAGKEILSKKEAAQLQLVHVNRIVGIQVNMQATA